MKKNKSVRGLILISLVSMIPLVALAQQTINPIGGIVTFGTIISTITNSIVRTLIALFATAAMAAFFYGIVQYIWGIRDGVEKKIEDGNKFMRWGMLALFVMFSVWGIVTYFQGIIGIQGRNTILIPDVQIQTGVRSSSTSPLGTSPAGGGAAGSKKANGYSCSTHAECSSGFCDPTDDVCTAAGSGNKKPNGYSCSTHAECSSGFCDPTDDTCTAAGSGNKKANGYSCATGTECQSGFCDPTDDVCTAQGSGNKRPNGFSCTTGTECESGLCDPTDDTCTAQGSANLKPANYSCTTDEECQSGLCDSDNTCG